MAVLIQPEHAPVGDHVLDRAGLLEPHPTDWDPFLLWGYDRFEARAFDWHPHRGFATLTIVLEGQLAHRDNFGGEGVTGPGDAQWMVAASGVWHDENPVAGEVEGLQLWFNLPAKHKADEPFHQDLLLADMPVWQGGDVRAAVYGGRMRSVEGPARLPTPALFARIEIEGQGCVPVPADHVAACYVASGDVSIDGVAAAQGQAVWRPGGGDLELAGNAVVYLIAGQPLREPVAMRMPLVMESEAALDSAFADLKAGRMGHPPV